MATSASGHELADADQGGPLAYARHLKALRDIAGDCCVRP